MNRAKLLLISNWLVLLTTVFSTVYLEFRVFELENRYTVLSALLNQPQHKPQPALSLETARQQRNQYQTQLQTFFQAEPVDAAWLKSIEPFIKQVFSTSGLRSKLLSYACKTTLCRLEALHDNPAQQAEFEILLPMLLSSELPNAQMFIAESTNGASKQIIYFARTGHKIRDQF